MNLRRARRNFVIALLGLPLFALGETRVVEISVVKRRSEGGVRTVRVAKGESVSLRVRSDEAMTIHVHGYDIELRPDPGSQAQVTFPAKIVGRFPVTAHLAHAPGGKRASEPTLLYLEVHPE